MATVAVRNAVIVVAHQREGAAYSKHREAPVLHAAAGGRSLCGYRLVAEQGWARVAHNDLRQVTCGRCRRLI